MKGEMDMSKMNELYEKVAASSTLQEKFAEIIKNAEVAGEEATKEKMVDFAKEAGYDVTVDELQKFFKGLVESEEGALSDVELDQVAGGKSTGL
jgi:predicted ribosomally synthesized peptide with nif11-like leader